ncbi:MAG: hypothetical protein ACLFR5_02480 [Halobacteriales archaeon]
MARDPSETIVLSYREEGQIDRRRLSGILGASTTLLLLLLIVALSLGAVGAAGIGIGGFIVEFSDVSAPSGAVYPAVGEQSDCDTAPQMMATLDGQAEIQGYFRITKSIPVPGQTVDGVSVNVLSEAGNGSSITAEDLDLRLTALSSGELILGGGEIKEYGPDDYADGNTSPETSYADTVEQSSTELSEADVEFSVNASGGFGIRRGRAVVYQIAFGNIDIADIGVTGSLYDGNVTLAGDYDCEEIKPPARTEDGNFTLPAQGNVSYEGAPEQPTQPANGTTNGTTNGTEANAANTTEAGNDTQTNETDTATEPEPEPSLEVVSVSPPSSVDLDLGDSFAVDLNVTNVGNATGDWRVYMNVTDDAGENATVASENVTLEPNDSADVSFEYEATSDDVPKVDATLGVNDLD